MHLRHTIARATIGWFAVFLQLLVSAETPYGLNLCVAEDGHATLEFSHVEPSCAQDSLRHHPDQRVIDAQDLARHPCKDVPLLGAAEYVKASQRDIPLPLLTALSAPAQSSPLRSLRSVSARTVDASVSHQQATHFLRTIILLV